NFISMRLFVLLLLTHCLFAQEEVYFNHTYDYEESIEVCRAMTLLSNSIVSLHLISGFSNKHRYIVQRNDFTGNLVWRKVYGEDAGYQRNGICFGRQ
ncbi:MAG: hypothetical protein ACPGVB_10605, partial [Chitinophagales bacterium]